MANEDVIEILLEKDKVTQALRYVVKHYGAKIVP